MGKTTKIKDLIPDNKNFNKGTEYGNSLIEKSLRKFGAGRSILIDKNNRIIAGNKTIENAAAIGLEDLQIVESDGTKIIAVKRTDIDLDSKAGRELALADNATAKANIDWDIETTFEVANEFGFDAGEWGIKEEEVEELEAEEDDFDTTPPEIPITVLGDLYEIGEHRLLCGDSTDSDQVAKLMNGEKADMVFTDPPYNIDYQGVKDKRDKIANDKMSDEDFTQFLYDALNINCDTFYVCCSWQYSHLFRKALEDLQKPVKSFIVWDKINPAQHLDKYFKQHEIILYHGKFGGQKTLRGDVWQTKRQKNTVHPTMKPIEIIEMALNDNTDKKQIYDAFLGSGSTMVATHQLKRKCYGMELDPKYCDVIVKRMIKLDPNISVKRNGVDCKAEFQ
jgi:DNA modification methylase